MRAQYTNQGSYYQMIPVHRQQVGPGASVGLSLNVRWRGALMDNIVMSGGTAILAAFYTPNRLLWTDDEADTAVGSMGSTSWEDFAVKGDLSERVPMVATGWDYIFEKSPLETSNFGRRAFKMIQNRFFGEKKYARSWYSNVFDDTDMSVKQTRIDDEFLGDLMQKEDLRTEKLSLPVVANAVDLDMRTLRRSLRTSMEELKEDWGPRSDSYARAMRKLGVNLGWQMLNEPQMLGMKRVRFNARSLTANDGTDMGKVISRFTGAVTLRTGRKAFKEHGQIMACLIVKPDLFYKGSHSPLDAHLTRHANFDFGGPDAGEVLQYNPQFIDLDWPAGSATEGETFELRKSTHYKKGSKFVGKSDAGKQLVPTIDRSSYDLVRYPAPNFPEEWGGQINLVSSASAQVLHRTRR